MNGPAAESRCRAIFIVRHSLTTPDGARFSQFYGVAGNPPGAANIASGQTALSVLVISSLPEYTKADI